MIKENFVIKAYYIPLKKHLKILEKIKNEYKINTDSINSIKYIFNFDDLPIQYRVNPESKSFGYIYDDTDFYKVEWKIKKFIDWKSFLNKDLTMETE